MTQVRAALATNRPSLSPSKFSEGAFEAFQEIDERAEDEDDVMANMIPAIIGPSHTSHPSARNTVFGNLDPITDGTIAPPKPDIYYGAYPEELSRPIRDQLRDNIMPSTMEDKPMVPNFFLEVKGPDGSAAVAKRQARYDGAVGSRAIHSLQNYGEEVPGYDGNAYTFNSIYHDGFLQMYAHHPTAPTTHGGRPGYHMTKVSRFDITNNRETFVEGATAFRNARDFAKRHRDSFIEAANTRPQAGVSLEARFEDSTSDEFVDCEDYISPPDGAAASTEHVALPKDLYDDHDGYHDDSQGPSQVSVIADLDAPPSMSFASSFTSTFTEQSRPKRQLSPPSGSMKASSSKSSFKSRTRPSTRTGKSASSRTSSKLEAEDGPIPVTTYRRKGRLYFKDSEGLEVETAEGDWVEQEAADGTACFWWQSPKSGLLYQTPALARQSRERKKR